MGFFSKIAKGFKKVFKKIGKGIKKVAGKVGKFMDKIGIVGQIGMAFILPGIGAAFSQTLGSLGAWASTAGGNALVQGAKAVVGAATKFVSTGARVFSTVTDGIKNFVGEVGKTALNKIPGINVEGASTNFFGADGAFGKAAGATADTWNTTVGSPEWMKQFDPYAEAKDFTSQMGDVVAESTGYTPATELPEGFRLGVDQLPEGFKSPAYGEISTGSLLTPASPDFTAVEGQSPLKMETIVDEPTGFTVTGDAVVSTIGNMAMAGVESLMQPAPQPDYSTGYGAVQDVGTFEVTAASPLMQMPQVGYGLPQVQYDAMYRPTSSWAKRMGGFS